MPGLVLEVLVSGLIKPFNLKPLTMIRIKISRFLKMLIPISIALTGLYLWGSVLCTNPVHIILLCAVTVISVVFIGNYTNDINTTYITWDFRSETKKMKDKETSSCI